MDVAEIASLIIDKVVEGEFDTHENTLSCMLINRFWFYVAARVHWRNTEVTVLSSIKDAERRRLYARFVERLSIDGPVKYDQALEFPRLVSVDDGMMFNEDVGYIPIDVELFARSSVTKLDWRVSLSMAQWFIILRNCARLESLRLNYVPMAMGYLTAAMDQLLAAGEQPFKDLRKLTLSQLPCQMLLSFGHLTHLKKIEMGFDYEMDDRDGLFVIATACPNIERVRLSEAGLAQLGGLIYLTQQCKNLRVLCLSAFALDEVMDDKSVLTVARNAINLEELRLKFTDPESCFGFDGCCILGQHCRRLHTLDLSFFTDDPFADIGAHGGLDYSQQTLDGQVPMTIHYTMPRNRIQFAIEEQYQTWADNEEALFPCIYRPEAAPRFVALNSTNLQKFQHKHLPILNNPSISTTLY